MTIMSYLDVKFIIFGIAQINIHNGIRILIISIEYQ